MTSNFYLQIIISFLNIILSLPFTILGLSKFNEDEIKADWQPPGYVFGIVWPILYMIFGYINLRTFNSKNLDQSSKKEIIKQSITEALLQTLWLIVTANYGADRNLTQNFIGLIVMNVLVLYCFFVRIPFLKSKDNTSFLLYIPYSMWIIFAFILNLQIVIKFINKSGV